MILSHKHKFVFVKNRKVAGTSVEVALSPHCGPDDILTVIDIGVTVALPHLKARPAAYRIPYRELYDQRSRQFVQQAFREEIDAFHYTF